MRRRISQVSLLLLLVLSCGGGVMRQDGPFLLDVSVRQGEKSVRGAVGTVTLEKAPFSLVFTARGPFSVYVHACMEDTSYRAAAEGKWVGDIPGFSGSGTLEGAQNPESALVFAPDEPNYWFFTSEEEHRFTSVSRNFGKLVCEREIKRFVFTDKGTTIPVDEYRGDSVYLVIMELEWNRDYSEKLEKSRRLLKIDFTSEGKDDSN